MGAGRVADIADALIAGGRAATTPVAAVRWGTRPEQRTIRGTLATIAELGVEAPSAIVVGEVAALDLGWFEHAPAVRPAHRRDPRARAGERVARPARAARRRSDRAAVDRARAGRLRAARARRVTRGSCSRRPTASTRSSTAGSGRAGLDARALAPTRVAAHRAGHRSARSPAAASAPTSFPSGSSPSRCSTRSRIPSGAGARVLLARAEQARDVLPEGLAARWATRSTCCPSTARSRPSPTPADVARVRAGEVDAVTFTSSSTVTNFCDAVGPFAGAAGRR